MPKTRLRQIYDKIKNKRDVCEFSSFCKHFQDDSDTCIKALDKTYCGTYNIHVGGERSE